MDEKVPELKSGAAIQAVADALGGAAIEDVVAARIEHLLVDEALLKWFRFTHLPAHLRKVSARFGLVAVELVEELPRCAERSVALRKLLEGKDAAVRAAIEGGTK